MTAVVAHAVLPALVSPVGEVGRRRRQPPARSRRRRDHGGTRSPVPRPATAPGDRPSGHTGTAIAAAAGDRAPIAALLPPEALTGYRWPLAHGRITLPFGPTRLGHARRRRRALPRRHRPGDVLRRPRRGGACRQGHRRRPPLRRRDGLGRRPAAVLRAGSTPSTSGTSCRSWWSSTTATATAASTPISARSRSSAARRSRPAQFLGPRGPDRPGDRLPRPLRAVQPARDRDVRGRPRRSPSG